MTPIASFIIGLIACFTSFNPRRAILAAIPPWLTVLVIQTWAIALSDPAQDPRSVEVPSAVWTTRLLSTYLERVMGHHTGIETVRIHLHRLAYVCKRPTWSLKRKSTEQAGWVHNA